MPKPLSSLYRMWAGSDVYVCGTGPSMRVMPTSFLEGRNVIGLNAAYRYCNPQISITIHPDEYISTYVRPHGKLATQWVTKLKGKTTLDGMRRQSIDPILVETTTDLSVVGNIDAKELFVGRGIHQSGVDLAIRMGAASVILVGVDMGHLGYEHHAHAQHVRFHGLPAEDVYQEYRDWMAVVRAYVRKTYGIPILSLSPLLGIEPADDYDRLVKELDLPPLPVPKDTSGYKRAKTDEPPSL